MSKLCNCIQLFVASWTNDLSSRKRIHRNNDYPQWFLNLFFILPTKKFFWDSPGKIFFSLFLALISVFPRNYYIFLDFFGLSIFFAPGGEGGAGEISGIHFRGYEFHISQKKIFFADKFSILPAEKKMPTKIRRQKFFSTRSSFFTLPTFLRVFNVEKIDLRTTDYPSLPYVPLV